MLLSLTAVIDTKNSLEEAQLIAEHWNSIISNEIIITTRTDFVSDISKPGHTTVKTLNLLNSYLGRSILIKDAHLLMANEDDIFGGEAVETLAKFLSDHLGQIGIILSADFNALRDGLFKWSPNLRAHFL
jgi:hypothetical protein